MLTRSEPVSIFSVTMLCRPTLYRVVPAHSRMVNSRVTVLQAEAAGPNIEVHVPVDGDAAYRGA